MIPLYYSPDVSSLQKFEMVIQDWFKYPHVFALESVTSCWSLLAILLKMDDSIVYCSPFTKLPSFMKHFLKKYIVYVDINIETGYMDPTYLSRAISKNTPKYNNIILIQHWNGYTCNMNIYNSLKNTNTIIIEDCSSIIGNNNRISQCNNIQIFEINNETPMCNIVGGLLVFPTQEMFTKCSNLLNTCYPSLKMNDVIAHQGSATMQMVTQRSQMSKNNARLLDTVLTRFEYLDPCYTFKDEYTYPTFAIRINDNGNCSQSLVNYMLECNIQCSTIQLNTTECENANVFYNQVVLIPCGFWVEPNMIDKIIFALSNWYKSYFNNTIPRLLEPSDYHKGLFHLLNLIEPLERTVTMSMFKNMLEINFNKFVYVIEMDGKIVGHAMLNIDYNQWFKSRALIDYIIIHPDYRYKGLGIKLIKHVIKMCHEQHEGPKDNIYIINMNYPNEFLTAVDFFPTTVALWKNK